MSSYTTFATLLPEPDPPPPLVPNDRVGEGGGDDARGAVVGVQGVPGSRTVGTVIPAAGRGYTSEGEEGGISATVVALDRVVALCGQVCAGGDEEGCWSRGWIIMLRCAIPSKRCIRRRARARTHTHTHARTHARAHVHSLILHVFFHDAHRAFSWGQYVFKAERERGGGGGEGAIANERET